MIKRIKTWWGNLWDYLKCEEEKKKEYPWKFEEATVKFSEEPSFKETRRSVSMARRPKKRFKVKRYITKYVDGITWKRQCRGCGRIVRTTNHANEYFCRKCKE